MILTSCIIPTRNRSHLLPRALESVRRQSCRIDEIVVVDDGSDDDTAAMLDRCYAGVNMLSGGGRGPGHARNVGAINSSGEYLFFLDSDDEWLPHHVESLLKKLLAGSSIVYGRVLNRMNGPEGSFLVPAQNREVEGECFAALRQWCFLLPSGVALSRHAYCAAGGFREMPMCEDWLFFLSLARSFPFTFAGEGPTVLRHLGQDSLCTTCSASDMIAGLRNIALRVKGWPAPFNEAYHRFVFLADWVEKRAADWTTVQNLYCRLQREGLL